MLGGVAVKYGKTLLQPDIEVCIGVVLFCFYGVNNFKLKTLKTISAVIRENDIT